MTESRRQKAAAREKFQTRPRARRMRPAERKALLVDAAIRAMATGGVRATRHVDVAREAETSLPTVFHYFANREDLVDEVLDRVEDHFFGYVTRLTEGETDASLAIWAVTREFTNTLSTHANLVRIWLDWSTAYNDELWPRYLVFHDRFTDVMAQAIRRGQQDGVFRSDLRPVDAARLIIGAAYAVAQLQIRGSEEEIPPIIEGLLRLFLSNPEDFDFLASTPL